MIYLLEECFMDLFISAHRGQNLYKGSYCCTAFLPKGKCVPPKMTLKFMTECLEENANGFIPLKLIANLSNVGAAYLFFFLKLLFILFRNVKPVKDLLVFTDQQV